MFGGCLVIVLALVLCSAVFVFAVDQLCYSTLTRRLPVYPGAEVRVERYNLFRALGMGETYIELHADEDSAVVSRWYGETVGPYQRSAIRSNDLAYRLATAERAVRRSEDRTGSFIQLYGTCAQ